MKLLGREARLLTVVSAILYVSAVPIYAYFYDYCLPHAFYADHVDLEPAAKEQAKAVAAVVKAALLRSPSLRVRPAAGAFYRALKDRLFLDDVRSKDGKTLSLRITLLGPLDRDIVPPTSGEFIIWRITPSDPSVEPRPSRLGSRARTLSSPFMTHWLIAYANGSPIGHVEIPTRGRLPLLDVLTDTAVASSTDTGVFDLGDDESASVETYLRGMSGDPSDVPGHFPRFLYFSAIVITTVGLGDIIPLTEAARLVVGSETICGIVLAGLFLNSLFVGRTKDPVPRACK